MKYDKKIRQEHKLEQALVSLRSKHEGTLRDYLHLQSVVQSLMHESRRFSAEIAASVDELSKIATGNANSRISELSDTIFYSVGLLSSRMTFSDYELNPQSIQRQTLVRTGIYKKFDKSRHILAKQAKEKALKIRFSGNSSMEIDAHKAFELVPFVLLDNAIKYSPPDQFIDVSFEEIRNRDLEVSIKSCGPRVSREEHDNLFARGMRGELAEKSGIPGEGLGLYLAKSLCQMNNISIYVEQSGPIVFSMNGIGYSDFNVCLRIKR